MIFSIVDRPRYGLLEHSEALSVYARGTPLSAVRTLFHPALKPSLQESLPYSIAAVLKAVVRGECHTLVVWSMGLTYLLLPLLRLLRRDLAIILVCHEPGGLRQRLRKTDPFLYAVIASAYEALFCRFADVIATPNEANSQRYGMPYVPLVFSAATGQQAHMHDTVVFLGHRSRHRSLQFFSGLAGRVLLSMAGTEARLQFFPTPETNSSQDKARLMRRALCTANIYSVPHNQSGVTPDSTRFGVPVIVSSHDAFAGMIRQYHAGIVIEANDISTPTISRAVHDIEHDFTRYSTGARRMFREHFGEQAFLRDWMPLLLSARAPR